MTFKSYGTVAAQAATTIAIDLAAKDAAGRYAAAQIALQVAAGFQSLSTGDLQSAVQQIETAALAKITDPGQVALITAIFNQGANYLQAAAQAAGALPLVSATVQGAAGEIAAGISAAADAYPAPTASAA